MLLGLHYLLCRLSGTCLPERKSSQEKNYLQFTCLFLLYRARSLPNDNIQVMGSIETKMLVQPMRKPGWYRERAVSSGRGLFKGIPVKNLIHGWGGRQKFFMNNTPVFYWVCHSWFCCFLSESYSKIHDLASVNTRLINHGHWQPYQSPGFLNVFNCFIVIFFGNILAIAYCIEIYLVTQHPYCVLVLFEPSHELRDYLCLAQKWNFTDNSFKNNVLSII